MENEHVTPTNKCPHCGHKIDRAMSTDRDEPPTEGSISVCLECVNISTFKADGTLRKPTDDELKRYENRPDVINVRHAIMAIRAEKRIASISMDPAKCEMCGKIAELRPYGPNNEAICFECGNKDPEATARTQRKFLELLVSNETILWKDGGETKGMMARVKKSLDKKRAGQ
jgi:hypothetical protein